MFGNLLNNTLIERLVHEGKLQIRPFESKKLQIAQYPLSPLEILYEKEGELNMGRHHLVDTNKPYIFQPFEYAIVIVREHIVLPDGIAGRFIPMSGLIESGFGLTAGKLDPHYGEKGEQIRFGLQNLRNHTNAYSKDSPLAYIEFFDLRGLPTKEVDLRAYDRLIRLIRREDYAEKSVQEMIRRMKSLGESG